MRFWRYIHALKLAGWPRRAHSPPADKLQRSFHYRRLMFDGTEYHYRVFVPVDWSHATSWPVILSLHGGGGYGSDNLGQISEGLGPAILEHAGRFPALVVFPQAPANGTPGWQAVGGRIALAALEQAIEEFHGDRSRVALTGMSIGGNGAWYLAYHHPQRFAALLVVCGFVAERMGTMHPILYPSLVPGTTDPYTVTARQLAHIPTWIFHGDADHSVPVEQSRRMAAALRALGAPVQYTELPGVDHNAWDYAYRRADVASWLLQPSAGG